MYTIGQIYEKIDNVIDFLQRTSNITNCNLVEFITKDFWQNIIPQKLKEDLANTSDDIIASLPGQLSSSLDSDSTYQPVPLYEWKIEDFIQKTRQCSLNNGFLISPSDLLKIELNYEESKRNANIHMTEKKAYEVACMSDVLAHLSKTEGISAVIELGCGAGYLGSFLSVFKGLDVFSVDSSPTNIAKAKKIYYKLIAYRRRKEKSQDMKKVVFKLPNIATQTFAIKYIRKSDDLIAIHKELHKIGRQKSQVEQIGLVGLHTCGSLAVDSCQMFVDRKELKMLLNLSCCYHLLKEEFIEDELCCNKYDKRVINEDFCPDCRYSSIEENPLLPLLHTETKVGFPMSEYLKKQKFYLGRQVRLLATNASIRTESQHKRSAQLLYWRALFHVILIEKEGCWPKGAIVGKMRYEQFSQYIEQAMKNINAKFQLSEADVVNYLMKYPLEKELYQFYMMRISLAPIIEGLIYLDRLAFLYEQGFPESYIVQMFDTTQSSRALALFSIRPTQTNTASKDI